MARVPEDGQVAVITRQGGAARSRLSFVTRLADILKVGAAGALEKVAGDCGQIAQLAGDFLTQLGVDEAEIAARFMVGRPLPQGEERRLQVSGRAIWRSRVATDWTNHPQLIAPAITIGAVPSTR